MVSIVILTKNEEKDLPRCLSSISWADDVHILDCGSTDDTVKIALEYSAQVSYNEFISFGHQRNHALDNLPLKYKWILFLDADEVVTPRFKEELFQSLIYAKDDVAGFYCCWKMMLEDRWLKYCDNFPKWQLRILKLGKARFSDFGHGQKEGAFVGKLGYLKEPYLHYSFSKGWTEWIGRHNKYSSHEARDRLKKRPPFKDIFSSTSSKRNPALKSWLSNVPGWPLLRFIQTYIFNGGFLEGKPGFIYCINMAYYEFLILIKMREIKKQEHNSSLKILKTPITTK